MIKPLWKIGIFLKLKHTLTNDPAILLAGIYPREMEVYLHTKTCTQIFIATLSVIDKD